MLAQKPPMGWNTWNTFGENISEQLIMETADYIVEKGYKDAGYEYIVIDDCWSLKERDENDRLVANPEKFPHGMKFLSDYVHSKGLKLGIYSCAGIRTCANYPSSYQHEYIDAKTFAEWGIDFLKYDFCYFPNTANCKNAYLTMSNALKASGREILFSMCNWGVEDTWDWARSVGAHMYRSTGDIFDNYKSMSDIAISQIDNLHSSAPGCYNDIDMMVVGMYNKGNVAFGNGDGVGGIKKSEYASTDIDYETHFALWCMFSAPLMIGGDIRNMNDYCYKLLTNKELISINQDEEARPPVIVNATLDKHSDNGNFAFLKILSNNEYALLLWNTRDTDARVTALYTDMGFPIYSGVQFEFKEVVGDSTVDYGSNYISSVLKPHQCKVIKFKVK